MFESPHLKKIVKTKLNLANHANLQRYNYNYIRLENLFHFFLIVID